MKTRNQIKSKSIAPTKTNLVKPRKPVTKSKEVSLLLKKPPTRPKTIFVPSEPVQPERIFNILIAVTGSVATVKLIELVNKIKSVFPKSHKDETNEFNTSINIKIVMTRNSKHFLSKEKILNSLDDSQISILDDEDEWNQWKDMGDPVLHIDLRKWADLLLIAPLDANSLAKLANGICDNLLTCVVRAWDISRPLIYCPAMNCHMYEHPLTKEHLEKLQSFGYIRVDCVEKRLACGDYGMGGMASVDTIANKVIETLLRTNSMISKTPSTLNQHPTYPIVPNHHIQQDTSHKSGVSDDIVTKYMASNILIKPTNHMSPGLTVNIGELSLKMNSGKDLIPSNGNQGGSILDTSSNLIKQPRINLMNSIKISKSTKGYSLLDCSSKDDSINDFDEESIDFDPSRLLEQTMITEDSITTNIEPRISSMSPTGNDSHKNTSHLGSSGSRLCGMSPIFNTSKFLALCLNKSKGCYTCAICKNDYKNRKSMARHFKEQHVQGSIHRCKACGIGYKRRDKLIKHNRERHPELLKQLPVHDDILQRLVG